MLNQGLKINSGLAEEKDSFPYKKPDTLRAH